MSVIVTVHGTFATGDESGANWWQRDSPFCQQISRSLPPSAANELSYEPFIWDGRNSETSRRKAGAELAEKLDGDKRPTVLVGHSHGGSVIDHALAYAIRKKLNLDHVEKIITVATPFLSFEPPRRLFPMLSNRGKSVQIACWLFGSILVAGGLRPVLFQGIAPTGLLLAQMLAGLTALFGGLWLYRRWHLPNRSKRAARLKAVEQKFGSRLQVFSHSEDEAFLGLRATVERTPDLFHTNFFEAKLSYFSLFIPLLLFLTIAASTTLTSILYSASQNVFSYVEFKQYVMEPDANFIQKLALNLHAIGVALGRPFAPILDDFNPAIAVVLVLPLLIFVFYLISQVLVHLTSYFLRPWSRRAARFLNFVTSRQIRDTAWGNDTAGESCALVRQVPHWMDERTEIAALPSALEERISDESNQCIANAVPKLRQSLQRLVTAIADDNGSENFWDTFEGDEFIHNTYFKLEEFNDLISKAIADAASFKNR